MGREPIDQYYKEIGRWWNALIPSHRLRLLIYFTLPHPVTIAKLSWPFLNDEYKAMIAVRVAATSSIYKESEPPKAPKEIQECFAPKIENIGSSKLH